MTDGELEEKIKNLPKNFLSKINFTDDCWLWTGALARGYGSYGHKRKSGSTHRFSWKHFNGEIPEALMVLHKCDVRNCINPSHLFLGTGKENAQDRIAKGRSNTTKLNKDQVIEIRKSYIKFSKGDFSQKGLARKYGVDPKTICNVVNHKLWIAV